MELLNLISSVMIAVFLLYSLWILICSIVGAFSPKMHYPPAPPYRFAVLICARNEEAVIGNLLDSLSKQEYPKDHVKVFVVAHNCTDHTADIARAKGAIVYERTDPEEATKGDALRYGVSQINQDFPGSFDALCLFDADNLASHTFLSEINAALHSGADVVKGCLIAKNAHINVISELFSTYWHQILLFQYLPHTVMGLPLTISGTGFAVQMETMKGGWNTATMLEDIEFSVQLALQGKKSILAPYAKFYDEQPTDWKTGLRQRYRWAAGNFQVQRLYLTKLLKAVPSKGASVIRMLPDVLINPIMLISTGGFLLKGIVIGASDGMMALLQYLLFSFLLVWIIFLPLMLMLFYREKMHPLKNLGSLFLFPYFVMLSAPLSIITLFDRHPKWKQIPHRDATTIDTIEKTDC